MLCVAMTIPGCKGSHGSLTLVSSSGSGLQIKPDFQTVIYRERSANEVMVLMTDLSVDALRQGDFANAQILVISMFLRPKAGSTPIQGSATNATFRHIIFVEDDIVGVYGGGGFLYPSKKASSGSFKGSIFDATLELIRSSAGFSDRLLTLRIDGTLFAEADAAMVSDVAYQLNTETSRRLGEIYFVIDN